jgi:hypothetical protein
MIYEYPKDFIVPITFSEDLVQIRDDAIRERDILIIESNLDNKKMNSDKMKYQVDNEYEKHDYKYDMFQKIDDNDHIKSILNDIDEDYADSETLAV